MKKITLLVVLCFSLLTTMAQVTINRIDFGSAGDWFYMAYDTVPANQPAQLLKTGGPNVNWDITTWIKQQAKDTTYFKEGSTFSGAPPGCNLVITEKKQTPAFLKITSSYLNRIYLPGDITSAGGELKQFVFPSIMGTNFKDSLKSYVTNLATAVGFPSDPSYDSVKINFSVNISSLIDAFGKLKISAGQFDVLRQKSVQQNMITFKFRNVNTKVYDINFAGANFNEILTTYTWYSLNNGNALLRANQDTSGRVTQVQFMLASSKGLRTFVPEQNINIPSQPFPNPAKDFLTIEFNSIQNAAAVLKVFNMFGSEVLESIQMSLPAGLNQLPVDLRELKTGLYFYTITANGFYSSNKFIKQ